MNLLIDDARGYQWWTVGAGRWWLKFGPVTLAWWCIDARPRLDICIVNRWVVRL